MGRNNRYIFTAMITVTLVVLTAAVCARAQSFKPVRQLTSNNIVTIAGSGDTLWMATERGFNYRTSPGVKDDWFGFEVNDLQYRFWGLGFGGGGAAALIDKDIQGDSIGFWYFNHAVGSYQQRYFKFSLSVQGDLAKPTSAVVFSNGNFWAPFNYGGLARYNPADNSVHVIRPLDANESLPRNLAAITDEDAGTKAVLLLDAGSSDSSIIITSPKTLWRYRPYQQEGKRWEVIDTNPAFAAAANQFVSFDAAFTVRKKGGVTLYSFITIVRDDMVTVLHVFDENSKQWRVAIDEDKGYSAVPAVNGCLYTILENGVAAYANKNDSLSLLMQPNEFRDMLRKAGDDPNPTINDILFLPKTDSTGMIAVATETGLYLCESAEPLANKYGDFTLYRYVRGVNIGDVYALPGVIRGESGDGKYDKCVFVYKLKKDGAVTIKVYDYNMSLVKTVVNGERRSAGKSRSTDPLRDVWDGTNNRGKRVWPGVYYFKITTSAGERLFGKVILAK
jgi:hypothetical protein